jgi:hypothetical protein
MADWRQIQARIRKAKASSDPAAQLADLYERTRDAMVAFELAQWHEKAGNHSDTIQWYTTAAQRFRRAQWRTKAEEALARLGAPVPEPPSRAAALEHGVEATGPEEHGDAGQATEAGEAAPMIYQEHPAETERAQAGNGMEEERSGPAAQDSTARGARTGKRRRRGRRGGRKRRGRGGAGQKAGAEGRSAQGGAGEAAPFISRQPYLGATRPFSSATEASFEPVVSEAEGTAGSGESQFLAEPQPVQERAAYEPAVSAWQAGSLRQGGLSIGRSRAGDPGLSSRIAQLESQLRRLLACALAPLDEADQAPAGPGVLLLSDSDQVTHYYVEACQTLRIGVGNLLRGGRGSKGGSQLKPKLAEHLGISDSRVSKYLKEHCAVRWIQLDEGAAELAHFAMAVLRPVVSE